MFRSSLVSAVYRECENVYPVANILVLWQVLHCLGMVEDITTTCLKLGKREGYASRTVCPIQASTIGQGCQSSSTIPRNLPSSLLSWANKLFLINLSCMLSPNRAWNALLPTTCSSLSALSHANKRTLFFSLLLIDPSRWLILKEETPDLLVIGPPSWGLSIWNKLNRVKNVLRPRHNCLCVLSLQ